MTPERYQQIGLLYHAALELEPQARGAFLDRECCDDEALRHEVESLLAADEKAENFIEAPALAVAAEMLAEAQAKTFSNNLIITSQAPTRVNTNATAEASDQHLDRKPIFFWLVLCSGALMLGSFVFAAMMTARYGALLKDFGWQYQADGDTWLVSAVDPNGAAAGKLKAGDRILAINGDTQLARLGPDVNLYLKRDLLPPDSRYTIRIEREAEERQFTLHVPLKRDFRHLARMIPELIVGLAFLVLAMLVGLFKPDERVTQMAFVAGLLNALAFVPIALFPVNGFLKGWAAAAQFVLFCPDVLVAAPSFHFFMLFPPGVPQSGFWKKIRNGYYLVSLIQFIPRTVVRLIAASGHQALLFRYDKWLRAYVQIDGAVFGVVALVGITAICTLIARNYRLVTEPSQRRRIRWIIYGAAFGLLPSVIHWMWVLILIARDPRQVVSPETNLATQMVMELAALAIPLTLGFAIFKHRLFDIRVVVRRGVQYLLAKNVLSAILFLPVAGLIYTILANRHLTVAELLFHNSIYFYLIALASVGLRFRRQLGAWVDRKFFREAYDRERILLELVDEVKQLDSMTEISRLVSRELEAALHPSSIYVFYREEEQRDLTLGYSSGAHSVKSGGLLIPESYKLLRVIEGETNALDSLALRRIGLPQHEQGWLDALGTNLIVPINANRQLAGLLLLGEKRSEEPYSPNDRSMLQAVAAQMAVVYENVLLKQRVQREQKRARQAMARLSDERHDLLKECPSCGVCYDATVQVCAKDGDELVLSLPVERTIDGKYRLEQLLGKGGMGAVYEATDLRLDRKLAIKIMTGSRFSDRTALRRFEREARASAKLNHPNIVTVYDYGAVGDTAYLAMERLDGFTLRAELKRTGKLDPTTAARWFDQILEGVKAAHAAGIIHRDLKPENVFICEQPEGRIKLLDFGLAKLRMIEPSEMSSITAHGVVMGTFGYMSPEQLTGEEVDERSDIFALGVMAVEALTGCRPFSGRTHAELFHSILRESFHFPGATEAARNLNAVLQRCLAKDQRDRFASAAELQAKLILAMAALPQSNLPAAAARSASDDEMATASPATEADY